MPHERSHEITWPVAAVTNPCLSLPSFSHPPLLHCSPLPPFQVDDILVLILVTPVARPFISPWSTIFLKELGRLTNSNPVVIENITLTSSDLARLGYEQNLFLTNFINRTM